MAEFETVEERQSSRRNTTLAIGGSIAIGLAALFSNKGIREKFVSSTLEHGFKLAEMAQDFATKSRANTLRAVSYVSRHGNDLDNTNLANKFRSFQSLIGVDLSKNVQRAASENYLVENHGWLREDAENLFRASGKTYDLLSPKPVYRALNKGYYRDHVMEDMISIAGKDRRTILGEIVQAKSHALQFRGHVDEEAFHAVNTAFANSLKSARPKSVLGVTELKLKEYLESDFLTQVHTARKQTLKEVAGHSSNFQYSLEQVLLKNTEKDSLTEAEKIASRAYHSLMEAGHKNAAKQVGDLGTGIYRSQNSLYNFKAAGDFLHASKDFVNSHVQIPVAPGMPGFKIFSFYPWKRGVPKDFAGALSGNQRELLSTVKGLGDKTLDEDVYFVGNKLIGNLNGNWKELDGTWKVKDVKAGFMKNFARIRTAEGTPQGKLGKFFEGTFAEGILNKLGLDQQAHPSKYTKMLTSALKNMDIEDYHSHPLKALDRILSGSQAVEDLESVIYNINRKGNLSANINPSKLFGNNVLQDLLPENLSGFQKIVDNGFKDDDLFTAFREIDAISRGEASATAKFFGQGIHTSAFVGENTLISARRFVQNPSGFLTSPLNINHTSSVVNLEGLLGEANPVNGIDKVREIFAQEILGQAVQKHGKSGLLDGLLSNIEHSGLGAAELTEAKAKVFSTFAESYLISEYEHQHIPIADLSEVIKTNKDFIRDFLNKEYGGLHPWAKPDHDYTGIGYYVTPDRDGWGPLNLFNTVKDSIQKGTFVPIQELLKQTRDQAKGQGPGPLFAAGQRINEMLAEFGLGLPDSDMQNPFATFGNIFVKRVLPAFGAVEAWKYVNHELHDTINTGPDEIYAQTKARIHLTESWLGDKLGLNNMLKGLVDLTPGLSNYFQPRSYEEQKDYLRNGYEPIRQGRWWLSGGRQAWYGEKTQYYLPSWYKRSMSRYQETDTSDLNTDDYWAHFAIPTPTHPLCVLPGQYVLQDNEPTLIENSKIGSITYNSNLEETKVIGKLEREADESFNSIFVEGKIPFPMQVTSNHEVLVIAKEDIVNNCRKDSKKLRRSNFENIKSFDTIKLAKYVRAKDVKADDYLITPRVDYKHEVVKLDLAEYFNCNKVITDKWIYDYLAKDSAIYLESLEEGLDLKVSSRVKEKVVRAIKRNKIARIPRYLELTKELAYIIGWFLAEGHTTRNQAIIFSLHAKELNVALQLIENIGKINPRGQVNYTISKVSENGIRLIVNLSWLACLLKSTCGLDCYNKTIPGFIYKSTPEIARVVLDTYLKGDGWINNKVSGTRKAVTTSRSLALGLCILGESLNYSCSISYTPAKGKITILDRETFANENWKISFPEENSKSAISKNNYLLRRIVKNIEGYYKGIVYDLEVKDGKSFTLISGIVHNSTFKHFFDPNWWEEKHRKDRPYLVNGEALDSNTYLGNIFNSTIGRLIRPRQHYGSGEGNGGSGFGGSEDYLGGYDDSLLHENYNEDGVDIAFGPSGGYNLRKKGWKARLNSLDPRKSGTVRDLAYNDDLSVAIPRGMIEGVDIEGMYGFMNRTWQEKLGIFPKLDKAIIQSPQRAYGWERRWWDKNYGGMGGLLNEVWRRVLPHRDRNAEEYNPLRNNQPDWMPGADYFQNYREGDPYVKIAMGEMRLPGDAYKAIHGNKGYSPLDKARILGDVAPYSTEYKVALEQSATYIADTQSETETERLKEELREIKHRTSTQKKMYDLFPYRFKQKTKRSRYIVKAIIDSNTIQVYGSRNPLRLAGTRLSQERIKNYLGKHHIEIDPGGDLVETFYREMGITPGKIITAETNADNEVSNDLMHTKKAVVYGNKGNLNKYFLKTGVGRELKNSRTAADLNARYSPFQRFYGKVMETITHMDTPWHTKFLKIRSPLEEYKRSQVYGTSAGDWASPWKTYLKPTMEAIRSKNILVATLFGGMVGTFFASKQKSKKAFGIAGAIAGLFLSTMTKASEVITGRKYIPGRVRKRRHIEEYYDALKYAKYKRLEIQASQMAWDKEGVDVQALAERMEQEGKSRKNIIQKIQKRKWRALTSNWAKPLKKWYVKKQNKKLNRILEEGHSVQTEQYWTAKALKYRSMNRMTIMGSKEKAPLGDVIAALPKYERQIALEVIAKGSKKEKREYYELLPEHEKAVLGWYLGAKARGIPKKESVEDFFKYHVLPDNTWAGWNESFDLNDARAVTAHDEGMNLIEMQIYPRNHQDAQIRTMEVPIPVFNRGTKYLRDTIHTVLSGQGVSNLDIQLQEVRSTDSGSDIKVNLKHNRLKDIVALL